MASSLVGVTMMAWGLMHSRPTLYNRSSSASSNIFIKRSTFGAVLNTSKTYKMMRIRIHYHNNTGFKDLD
jgi:hypothetical protein